MEVPRVLSLQQAAETLMVSRPVLRRAIRNGQIPVIRLGLRKMVIPLSALEKYLANAGAGNANKCDDCIYYKNHEPLWKDKKDVQNNQ